MTGPSDENSNISRWIAFLVGPLVLLISGFVALKAKAWFNLDVSSQDVAAYVFGLVLSLGGILTAWLHNRGKFEIAKATGLTEDRIALAIQIIEDRMPKPPDAPPRAPGEQHLGGPPR